MSNDDIQPHDDWRHYPVLRETDQSLVISVEGREVEFRATRASAIGPQLPAVVVDARFFRTTRQDMYIQVSSVGYEDDSWSAYSGQCLAFRVLGPSELPALAPGAEERMMERWRREHQAGGSDKSNRHIPGAERPAGE